MRSDNRKKLKEALHKALSPLMREKGFKAHPRKDAYIREHEGRTDVFQLVFLEHNSGWRVRPHVGVRHERVENIFHQTSGFEQKYQKDTSTVGASVEAIVVGTNRAYEYILESLSQLDEVANELLNLYVEAAAPYFDR
ncbi:hypothetical protein [Dyella nitratireducens]|uniref:DUF4304 domain-containing protein n=1 Tax=Dyella nitratireducens TaxID=1849580 RepID=A0ABQ1GAL8_9GAMM|nr:hypothetical protein [Dyella nitratireducens]GGA39978.1 hypothetical protein GCM10010981_31550 [Dyella nitratireducens]GLQ40512.1 hypothetical protein GCM10007902_03610 [Dyella nitratireducens]